LADERKISHLASCQIYKTYPYDAKSIQIVFVSEAPSDVDYITRQAVSDDAGQFLVSLIQKTVPKEIGFIILHAVNCVPWVNKQVKGSTKTPSMKEFKTCSSNHLAYFLRCIKPRHVFALGKNVTRVLKHIDCPSIELPSQGSIYYSKHQDLEIKRFTINLRNALDAEKESTT
jgi:uracil-DNA glycosylase